MTSPIEPEKRAFAVVVGEPDPECGSHIWEPGVECLGVLVVESEDIQADLGVAKRIASRLTQAVSEALREKDARIRELEGALKAIAMCEDCCSCDRCRGAYRGALKGATQ
jgi:hypothetical protein